MVTADQTIVNSGTNLINYLRGQSGYGDGVHFRTRAHVLGDLVDSRPAVVRDPRRHYADASIAPGNQSYATFASNNASRQAVIYVGGNDGMLHAFNATNGNEMWAYIPRFLLSRLYVLADVNYAVQHQFFVDGSPEVADVLSPSDGTWHTILITGMNDGGRGYVAFDVTNPSSPTFLWEFCNDSTICTTNHDANLCLTFGNPVVTKRAYDGKWVVLVASGYNNVGNGDGVGRLYELDPFTGAILQTASTGVGSTTSPSGLAKITAMVTNPDTDNTARFIYGGDLQGNLWRFDLTGASMTVSAFATLQDAAGKPQPITTRPELGQVNNYPVVFVGTGRLLGQSDLLVCVVRQRHSAGQSACERNHRQADLHQLQFDPAVRQHDGGEHPDQHRVDGRLSDHRRAGQRRSATGAGNPGGDDQRSFVQRVRCRRRQLAVPVQLRVRRRRQWSGQQHRRDQDRGRVDGRQRPGPAAQSVGQDHFDRVVRYQGHHWTEHQRGQSDRSAGRLARVHAEPLTQAGLVKTPPPGGVLILARTGAGAGRCINGTPTAEREMKLR
jgi:hypothetical protein